MTLRYRLRRSAALSGTEGNYRVLWILVAVRKDSDEASVIRFVTTIAVTWPLSSKQDSDLVAMLRHYVRNAVRQAIADGRRDHRDQDRFQGASTNLAQVPNELAALDDTDDVIEGDVD